MTDEILSYLEMCQREGISLQRGMNFRAGNGYSIVLMSQRPNAPYRDRIEDNGASLIYEGHDEPNRKDGPDPKLVDQPAKTLGGKLTENGKFAEAARQFKRKESPAEPVRVYEKIHPGIWSNNGLFLLVDSWIENDGRRRVYKFKLTAAPADTPCPDEEPVDLEMTRLIPTAVKLEVWRRDGGRCVTCGATDNLHFDHIIPYSKGGTSLHADNIQLLCARHNLEKRDRIM